MVTPLEETFIGLTVLTEIAYYGIKAYDYYTRPEAMNQIKQDVAARRSRGEIFPRMRAYAPIYLPFPLDILTERNQVKLESEQ